jgi:Asp-tRNA(Asn)/Glu-tRNA(Gln) amidotransferase C subunit
MWSKTERARELARLAGIAIVEDELAEVADRLDSLLIELEKVAALDLADIEPVTVFNDGDGDGR